PGAVEQAPKGGAAPISASAHAGGAAREVGREYARRDLWSYAVVDAYAANFERAGFADEVAEIRDHQAAGDRDGAIAAVSDRFVDAIDVMGDAATVRSTVEAYVAGGVDVPVLMPLPWGPDRMAVIDATMRAAVGAA
ncbi:MAG TPA: LLM class flavin-dependent oxidoreductase, partial [Acidimicrobiales bacterium]|nr:LLM class flavin-dependent oxidoreductase [Acidimicrobiales bacterium]